MDEIRQYIISISISALICGILKSLCNECRIKKGIEMLCGLIMVISLLQPITSFRFEAIRWESLYSEDAEFAVQQGEKMVHSALSQSIKEQTEAYILDKANQLQMNIAVEVFLSQDDVPVPVSVDLSGDCSFHAQEQLSAYIAKELNIPKEDQNWNG